MNFFGTDHRDTMDFILRRPMASRPAARRGTSPSTRSRAGPRRSRLPDDPALGLWHIDFRINGEVLTTESFRVGAAPEPQTYALLGAGLMVLGGAMRRHTKRAAKRGA